MKSDARIFVAGHRGLVGSSITRRLEQMGFSNVIRRTRAELDLSDPHEVDRFFADLRPEYVFVAAAKVGGIMANSLQPVEFLRENLAIAVNLTDASAKHGVTKLLLLGSSCIYPREAPQPMKEEYLLTGPLEPTNAAYAIAKIAGLTLAQAHKREYGRRFISAMPTNLYGPGDNFDLETSHVIPALIRKFHEAKTAGAETVTVWGSGTPRREFLYVDDLAEACVFLMRSYEGDDPINVGVGKDISIRELADAIANVVGFEGQVVLDPSKPDGSPRKLLDVSRIGALGWRAATPLVEGLARTYAWYVDQIVRDGRHVRGVDSKPDSTRAA